MTFGRYSVTDRIDILVGMTAMASTRTVPDAFAVATGLLVAAFAVASTVLRQPARP